MIAATVHMVINMTQALATNGLIQALVCNGFELLAYKGTVAFSNRSLGYSVEHVYMCRSYTVHSHSVQ
jgi:phosphoribosylformylglycinamidine (FGAM) synthase-like amidotransferase family enzyme